VVERAVGPDRLRSEVIDDLVPDRLVVLLEEADLVPALRPTLERLEEEGDGVAVEVRVTLWPTLDSVPSYKDHPVELPPLEVTEEELDQALERMRDQYASLETADRAAAPGDYVSVDVSATVDGEPLPEAEAHEVLYEVGSGGLLEGADAHLEGKAAGEDATFDSVLPSGFGDRSGQSATFTVKVNEVKGKILPELDDEWVSETTEFETVEELSNALASQLALAKKRRIAVLFRQRALDSLVDGVEIELPEGLVRAEMDTILHRFVHRLHESGIKLDDYLRVTGITQDGLLADLRGQADRSIRTQLVLESVASAEDVEVSAEEMRAVVDSLAARSQRPDKIRRALSQGRQEDALRGDILRNKALAAIMAGAQPVDADGTPIDIAEVEFEAEVVEDEPVEADIVASEESQ
jgi:trigger factor